MFRNRGRRYSPRQCTPPGHQATGCFRLEMITSDDRLTVLLAEDDENDFMLLNRAMAKLGTVGPIVWVRDGEEARAYLCGHDRYASRDEYPPPSLLILDQRMPKLNGLDLLHWLRQQPKFDRLPVVVWTVFEPGQELAIKRLNAAPCAKSGDLGEMGRSIGDATVRAFRLASLVPDVAWYRTIGHRPLHVSLSVRMPECLG
jgi:CheY-like chemotaxis protein